VVLWLAPLQDRQTLPWGIADRPPKARGLSCGHFFSSLFFFQMKIAALPVPSFWWVRGSQGFFCDFWLSGRCTPAAPAPKARFLDLPFPSDLPSCSPLPAPVLFPPVPPIGPHAPAAEFPSVLLSPKKWRGSREMDIILSLSQPLGSVLSSLTKSNCMSGCFPFGDTTLFHYVSFRVFIFFWAAGFSCSGFFYSSHCLPPPSTL